MEDKMKKKKPYLKRLGLVFDQGLNVLLLNGHEDHTISGRVGYKAHTTKLKRWLIAEMVINAIFFWDEDHCYNSIEWDRASYY